MSCSLMPYTKQGQKVAQDHFQYGSVYLQDSTTTPDYLFQCLTKLNFKLKNFKKNLNVWRFFSSEVLDLYV